LNFNQIVLVDYSQHKHGTSICSWTSMKYNYVFTYPSSLSDTWDIWTL